MAERTVFWKAVADFSSIARQAALARRELDSLDKKEKKYTQDHADRVNKQVAANKNIIDSNRQVSTSSLAASRGLTDFAKAQRAAGDSTVRFSRVLQTNASELTAANTKMRTFTRSQDTMRLETDRSYMSLHRFNQALGDLNDYGESGFSKMKNAAVDARKEIAELRDQMRETAGTAESNSRAQVAANARVEASANKVAARLDGVAAKMQELSRAQNDSAQASRSLSQSLSGANDGLSRHDSAISQSKTTHKTFRTDIDGTSIALGRMERALANLANSAPGLSSFLTSLINKLGVMDDQSRRNTSSLSMLNSALINFKGEGTLDILSRFSNRLTAVGGLATVAADGIGKLSGALAMLGPGLIGMMGALSPVVGLLGILPGLATATAGAFGSTIGALTGVGSAYKAYTKQQESSAKTSAAAAKQQQADNKKLLQSEIALSTARRNAARSIKDAERSVRDARESSARAQVDTARSIKSAEQNLVRSKESVVAAERRVVKAQQDVNQARVDAVRNLRDLERASKSYALQEEGAVISLEESRLRLKEVMADPGSTDLQRRAANLAVREAEARLEEVRQASTDQEQELADARRKGVEGSDQVVSALESERSAYEAVKDSKRGVADSEEALVRAREDASRSIRDANEAVIRAEEGLRDAQVNAAESTQKAADAMQEAALAASSGTDKVDEFAEAMAKLSPQGRAVVNQLIAMRDGWDKMQDAAEKAALPGVLVFLKSVETLFPRITKFVSEAGSVMGEFFTDLGRMITTQSAMDGWNKVLDDGIRIMENFKIGLLNIAEFLGDIAVAAADAGLNDWLGEIIVGWTEAWKAWSSGEEGQARAIAFFDKAMRSAELLGSIVGGLAGFFFNTGQAGEEAGWKILTSFDNALKRFNEWANTDAGFSSIQEFANDSVTMFQELGLLIVAVAQGMAALAKHGEAGAFIRQLREEFGPVLFEILKQLGDANVLGGFVTMISKIGKSITESGLLTMLGDLVNHVMELASEAIPALTPFITVLINVLDGLARALTWVFREMNNGNGAIQGLVGGFVTLVTIAALGILIKKIYNFVKSFKDGFKDVANILIKSGDNFDKFENKVSGAVDRIVRHLKRLDQAQNSAGFTFAEGAEPRRRLADDQDITRRQPRATQPVRVSGGNAGVNLFRGTVPATIPAPKIDTRAAKEAASRAALGVTDEYIDGVRRGLRQGQAPVANAAKNVGDAVDKGVRTEVTAQDGLRTSGFYTDGLTRGLKLNIREVRNAAEDVGEAVVDGTENELEIKSPSRVGIKIAKNFIGAIADTLRKERGSVGKAGEDVGEELVDGVEKSTKAGSGRLKGVLGGFGGAVLGVAKVGAAAIGVGAVATVGFLSDVTKASQEARAVLNRTNQTFGESSSVMQDWAAKSARSMGMTKTETLDLANNFGILFRSLGFSEEQTVKLTQEMSLLAAGIAAANPDITTLDAFHALEDAFRGDYDAISKLYPAINQAAIEQHALEMTGKKATEELTEQEKQAALTEIAQGKLSEASQTLADKQGTVAGKTQDVINKWQEFKEKLGEKVENKLGELVADLEKPGTALYDLKEHLKKLVEDPDTVDAFVTALEGLATALVKVTEALADAVEIASGDKTANILGTEWGAPTNVDKAVMEKTGTKRKLFSTEADVSSKDRDRLYDEARNELIKRGEDTSEFDRRERDIINKRLRSLRGGNRAENERRLHMYGAGSDPARAAASGAPDTRSIGKDSVSGISAGMDAQGPEFQTAIDKWVKKWLIQPIKDLLGIKSPSTLFAGFGGDIVAGLFNGIVTAITTAPEKLRKWFGENVVTPVKEFFGIASPSTVFAGFGGEVVAGFLGGVLTAILTAPEKLRTWFDQNVLVPVKEFLGIQSPSTVFFGYAQDVIAGFINGIVSKAKETYDFVKRWFDDNVTKPVKEFLGIQSPSTVFFGFAQDVITGFINGIVSKARETYDFIKRWFDENISRPVKEFLGIASPSRLFAGFGADVIQGFINGIDGMAPTAKRVVSSLVNELGAIFSGIKEKFRTPTEFVVNTVYNKGILPMWNAVATLVGLGKLDPIQFSDGGAVGRPMAGMGRVPQGYATGGYTGPGGKYKPAGIVHADEFVVRKESRRKVERQSPGLLDHINRTGTLPGRGYANGGLVGDVPGYAAGGVVSYRGHRFTDAFARRIALAERIYGRAFNITQGGFRPATSYSGTSHQGDALDITQTDVRAVAALRRVGIAAWDRTGKGRWIPHIHGVPLPGHGSPAGSAVWQAQDYLSGGDGLGGRDNGPRVAADLNQLSLEGIDLSAASGGLGGLLATAFDRMGDLITKPLDTMKGKFGDSPWVEALMKMPKVLSDKAKAVLDKKLADMGAAMGFTGGMSGGVAGADWQNNATLLMKAGKAMGLSRQAMKIALMTAAQESSMGTNRTAMTKPNGDGDVGWFQQRTTRGDGSVAQLADPAYGLGVFIHGKRVPAGYHVPGLYNIGGWQGMRPGDAAQRVQVSAYPRAYDKWEDEAENWLSNFEYASGGWTGPGSKYKPAGIVHADEFVVSKSSRRKFEQENPGTLDYINQTGKLPGYHAGGRVLRTGGEGGTWWKKGTYSMTGKWIGALRHFMGLDNWWGGWDDDLDNAIKNYDGRPATHVYLPEWRPIMDAMRRLPVQEFSSAQNVAEKIGVHPDKIFRMIDTNRMDFNRDLGDSRKIEGIEPSYARFRDFHKESVEELQKVLGVPADGYWNMNMREMLVHVKDHITGKNHSDSLPTGEGWSDVGSWGAAFDEVLQTNRLNAEWDRMMDQFYEWGYDSLIRHLKGVGTENGMELARDLYNVPLNARDADVYYREFYEREDRINDENSELNRMRSMVNYMRRYDNVGLQQMATELQVTMDTAAMLFRKAQGKGMMGGLSASKISRMDKDIINFDKIFRFALGGLVPGSGNMDSVMALLTPGEYVLTKDQTKEMIAVQKMFAQYSGPSMGGANIASMSAMAGRGNTINNNVEWKVTQNITAPNPHMTSVKVQQGMKKLADDGLGMGGFE